MDPSQPTLHSIINSDGDAKMIERALEHEIEAVKPLVCEIAQRVINERKLPQFIRKVIHPWAAVYEMDTILQRGVMDFLQDRAAKTANPLRKKKLSKADERLFEAIEAFSTDREFTLLAEAAMRLGGAVNRVIKAEFPDRHYLDVTASDDEGNEVPLEDVLSRILNERGYENVTPLSLVISRQERRFVQQNISSKSLSPKERVALAFSEDDFFEAASALRLADPQTTKIAAVERLHNYLINHLAVAADFATTLVGRFEANFDTIRQDALYIDQVRSSKFVIKNSHIGLLLDVSGGRVTQLAQQAVDNLRQQLLLPQD